MDCGHSALHHRGARVLVIQIEGEMGIFVLIPLFMSCRARDCGKQSLVPQKPGPW